MLCTVSVIGGDLRQLTLASLLEEDGYQVKILGFDKQIDIGELTSAKDIADAANAKIIILPLPATQDNLTLNTPFYESEIDIAELFNHIPSSSVVFGGKLSACFKETCELNAVRAFDYFEREELSIANAIPTAEGAIELALSETPHTLHKSKCLVIGYGRIGKILADRLGAFGAEVTVSARKYSDFAWIDANGFQAANSHMLQDKIEDYQIIFNTVPSVILNEGLLEKIPKNTLIIDLASKPGGVDFQKAKELGLRVIWALSLPGKVAPITSGEIIKNSIVNILKEMEEL